MANINSFSENMRQVVANQVNEISQLAGLQQSMVTNSTYVTYNYTDKDGSTYQFQIPSYVSLNNRLNAIEESLASLSSGSGLVTVRTADGNSASRRTVKLESVAKTPDRITGVIDPSRFSIDSNWFFEEIMFPCMTVNIDLTNLVDDDARQAKVKRVILDSRNSDAVSLWSNQIYSNDYSYQELVTVLQNNNVAYSEDEEIVDFPLVANTAQGSFTVINDPTLENNNIWYQLDSLVYFNIDTDGTQTTQNILSVGDTLRLEDSLYNIIEINQNENKVRIQISSGADMPGLNSVFYYWQDPYRNKTLDIKFGAHEYDIIYIKAVKKEYSLVADEWSTPIKFDADSLVYSGDNTTSLSDFYVNNVVDWGANMIAEAKEKRVSAYYGKTPNAPVLSDSDFKVVQINTQINAALDTNDIVNNASEIESTKSEISSLKSEISAQKTQLANTYNSSEYTALQKKINDNTTKMQNLQASYSTLVKNLQNTVKENGAVNANPKYHIRGFFPIPELKFKDDSETVQEEIIGFEVKYHYIKEDSTAISLEKYDYVDRDGNQVTGVYTDWVSVQTPMKHKVYNSATDSYEWNTENTANGEEININQIDIPITKGEKVEFMVRSISEAGWPNNPLKSEWSNSIVVSFPTSLSTDSEIANLITEINDDALDITINNTLESLGLTSHISDSVPNVNSVNGLYYNHIAKNIAYEETTEDGSIKTISVQDALDKVSGGASVAKVVSELQSCCTTVQTRLNTIDSSIALLFDRLNSIESLIRPLTFSITSFTATPAIAEAGTSIMNLELNWNVDNKSNYEIVAASINNVDIAAENKNFINKDNLLTKYYINQTTTLKTPISQRNGNDKFILSMTINNNGSEQTFTKETQIQWYNPFIVWTSTNDNNIAIPESGILKSGNPIGSTEVSINANSQGYYVYVAYPKVNSNVVITNNGLVCTTVSKNTNATYNNVAYDIVLLNSIALTTSSQIILNF